MKLKHPFWPVDVAASIVPLVADAHVHACTHTVASTLTAPWLQTGTKNSSACSMLSVRHSECSRRLYAIHHMSCLGRFIVSNAMWLTFTFNLIQIQVRCTLRVKRRAEHALRSDKQHACHHASINAGGVNFDSDCEHVGCRALATFTVEQHQQHSMACTRCSRSVYVVHATCARCRSCMQEYWWFEQVHVCESASNSPLCVVERVAVGVP